MRIFLTLLLISVVPVLAVGSWTAYYATEESRRNVSEGSALYVEQIANRMSEFAQDTDSITQTAFSDRQFQTALRESEMDELERQSIIDRFLLNVDMSARAAQDVIVVAGGRAYSRKKTIRESSEYLRTEQNWYSDAALANGGIVISSQREKNHPNAPRTASISRAVLDLSDPHRQRIGFLSVEIDPNYLAELCGQTGSFGESRVVICDQYGRILYSSAPVKSDTLPLQPGQYSASKGSAPVELDGVPYLMNYRTSAVTRWKVFQFVPESYIDQLGNDVFGTNLGVALLCATAAVIFSVLLSTTLTRPLYRLRTLVRRIGAGELGATEEHLGGDLVGELGDCINHMSQDLEEMVYTNYEMKLRTKEAELRSLQNQINPHFLYNTLASIQLLAVTRAEPEIARMVEQLGAFFHLTISEGGETVPLSQELRLVELYVSLQKVRFGERIHYICTAPQEFSDLSVPKLILQPLVENAIIHGLEEKIEPGTVTLTVRREENCILIVIADDGVGMDEAELARCRRSLSKEKEPPGHVSIGMRNVEERLRLYSGRAYGLQIQSKKGEGTTVSISLPAEGSGAKSEEKKSCTL